MKKIIKAPLTTNYNFFLNLGQIFVVSNFLKIDYEPTTNFLVTFVLKFVKFFNVIFSGL